MSQRLVHVEAQRTFVTPRGRKFVPREPKKFEMSLEENVDLYASLKDKITAHFPRLQGQYQILYKDLNDELIPLSDKGSLEIALNATGGSVLSLYIQGEWHHGKWSEMMGSENTPQCSYCSGQIVGVRTKCLQCEEYNLCTQCEAQGVHANHVMVQCDKPPFFIFALPRFAALIPALCKEHIKNATDPEHLPRLDAKKLRQFWMSERKLQNTDEEVPMTQRRNNHPFHPRGMWRHCHHSEHADDEGTLHQGPLHPPSFIMRAMGHTFHHGLSAGHQKVGHTRGQHRGGTMRWMHMNVPIRKCNECDKDIEKTVTKCLECEDFYLCVACDEKDYHTHHVMLQTDRPRLLHFAFSKFGEAFTDLCAEHKEKYAGVEKIPRIKGKDVRQFWQRKMKQNMHEKSDSDEKSNHKGCRTRRMHGEEMPSADAQHTAEPQCPAQNSGEEMDIADGDDHFQCPKKPNIQQMKRQWMENCRQAWRKRIQNTSGKSTQAECGRPENSSFWRPYMMQCWDQWQEMKDETQNVHSGSDEGEMPHSDCGPRDGHCNARRQWIQACRRLWQDEGGKLSDDTCHRRSGHGRWSKDHGRFTRCNGPFPGFHMMMNRSWRLMMDQERQGQSKESNSDEEPENRREGSTKATKIGPNMAKQILKQTWVKGCREIWWIFVKKRFGLASDPVNIKNITHTDVMKEMANQQKIKMYLAECWRLWLQLSRQAGMPVKSSITVEHPSGEANKPRAMWMKEMLPIWIDDTTKQKQTKDGMEQLMWEKRPFPGWFQLILKSWEKIGEYTQDPVCGEQHLSREACEEYIQGMKQAYEQHMEKGMAKMTLSDDSSNANDSEDCDHDVDEMALTKEERKQLKVRLMEQYWSDWEHAKESACNRHMVLGKVSGPHVHMRSKDHHGPHGRHRRSGHIDGTHGPRCFGGRPHGRGRFPGHHGPRWVGGHHRPRCMARCPARNQPKPDEVEQKMEHDTDCNQSVGRSTPRLRITLSMKSKPSASN